MWLPDGRWGQREKERRADGERGETTTGLRRNNKNRTAKLHNNNILSVGTPPNRILIAENWLAVELATLSSQYFVQIINWDDGDDANRAVYYIIITNRFPRNPKQL